MGSPRKDPEPLNLDSRTFGDAPAARYLVEYLNERQDRVGARKVARVLAQGRELVAAVARAHLEFDALDTRAFARLLPMLSENLRRSVCETLEGHDVHLRNLTLNVMEGSVKTWKRRVEVTRRKERQLAKHNQGRVESLFAAPVAGEVTAEMLQARSKRYLARKGKKDTLY